MKTKQKNIIIFGSLFLILLKFSSNVAYFNAYLSSEQYAEQMFVDPIAAYAENIDLTQVPPHGSPPNLPGEKSSEREKLLVSKNRGIYGGSTDKPHLGGFTSVDPHGISPMIWKYVLEYLGVKTLLDVGCGRGLSTSWFYLQGVKVQCVEGSHDAFDKSMLLSIVEEKETTETGEKPDLSNVMVEHDFSRGPWWPEETVDVVWCVELLEHIGRNFEKNYLTAFKKAAFIIVTHSKWGGWHHTEVHDSDWWKTRFAMNGFLFSSELTTNIRGMVRVERLKMEPFPIEEVQKTYFAQHLLNALVFVNPAVASRIEHAHLLSEPGCFNDYESPNSHCGEEKNAGKSMNTKIPDNYKFIPFNEDKHYEWENYVKKAVQQYEKGNTNEEGDTGDENEIHPNVEEDVQDVKDDP